MSNFSRTLTIMAPAVQALLAPIGFPGSTPAPLGQNALAATVLVQNSPVHRGWIKRVRRSQRERRSTKKRSAKMRRSSVRPSAGAEAARVIRLALRITHEPRSWIHSLEWLAFRESTNNPSAVAYEGVGNETAQGLFQVLPTTFMAHALPHMRSIWNPVDNTVAAIRYIAGRYGTPQAIPGLGTTNYAGY